jgi:DNA polymerase-3 subunit epsilon
MGEDVNTQETRRMISALEMSGFKVLRRFAPAKKLKEFESMPDQAAAVLAMFISSRQTGAGGDQSPVVELGYQVVRFNPKTGVVYEVESEYSGFEDPGFALSPRFKAARAVEDRDVAGTKFDDERIVADIERCLLFVCHDAAGQRAALERRFPSLADKWFVCSEREMDWRMLGVWSRQLEYLAFAVGGYFYTAKRAVVEAQVMVDLMARRLEDGTILLKTVIERSKRPAWRLWAKDAPLEARDALEESGYKWSDGTDKLRPILAWGKVTEALDRELEFLSLEVYDTETVIPVEKVTGKERYSGRRGAVEATTVTPRAGASGAAVAPPPVPHAEAARQAPRQASPAPAASPAQASRARSDVAQSQRSPTPRKAGAQSWSGAEFPI